MKKPKGQCVFCGNAYTKGGMTRHLKSCKARKAAMPEPIVADSAPTLPIRESEIFHIKVESTDSPLYWMHIEVPADEPLDTLDLFLRHTWLECCWHMSAFTIGEDEYFSVVSPEYPNDLDMKAPLQQVLKPGMDFLHEYDFGSTTRLTLTVIGTRVGKVRGRSINIMARNNPLGWVCDVCGQPASLICTECMWDEDADELFCDEHAEEHECGEETMLPVVNSPRMGVCGYTG